MTRDVSVIPLVSITGPEKLLFVETCNLYELATAQAFQTNVGGFETVEQFPGDTSWGIGV